MRTITIVVPGEPVPQGRGKVGKWKSKDGREGVTVRDPAKSRNWKATAQEHMRMTMERIGLSTATGPVAVEIEAVFACPVSEYRKRNPRGRRWCMRAHGDCDNLGKASLDAGNGVLYVDDRQVVDLRVRKWIGAQGEAPYVKLTAMFLAEPAPEQQAMFRGAAEADQRCEGGARAGTR